MFVFSHVKASCRQKFKIIPFKFDADYLPMNPIFNYGTGHLTSGIAVALAANTIKATLSTTARNKIIESQQRVHDIVQSKRTVYGVNTGFGALANSSISEEDARTLQYKILQSHSVGVGAPVAKEIAKLMLITKVHALSQGYSGVQLPTLERILWHINNDIIPIVPEKGSVGA